MPPIVVQIVFLDFVAQNFRLLRETRHVREARRPAARTPAHEALLRFPVKGLCADVARLALGVLRAFLGRNRHGGRVLCVGIILLGTASFPYQFAELVVASLLPMLFLASRSAVPRLAAAALLGGQRWQCDSADGALREDHRAWIWAASTPSTRRSLVSASLAQLAAVTH
jgi:hypothetical protein